MVRESQADPHLVGFVNFFLIFVANKSANFYANITGILKLILFFIAVLQLSIALQLIFDY